MGNGQSIFYPDNGNRHDRAQQLANDCQYYKAQFETKKAALEKELGPYYQKITEVMQAFGCADLDDLNRLVHSTANREALEKWDSVKDLYDKTQMIDQVLFGIMGIVAVVGLSISIIGTLAGGIGFFAGISATESVLLALGILTAILDAVFGAINRAKLREAINDLFPARIRLKRALSQLENLELWMPIIKTIYQAFEVGQSKDEIIARLRTLKFDIEVKVGIKTFYEVASDLRSLDESRGSWTEEDPDWQSVAAMLSAPDIVFISAGGMNINLAGLSVTNGELGTMSSATVEEPPSIDVTLQSPVAGVSDILSGRLTLVLQTVVDEISAVVAIWTDNKTKVVRLEDHRLCLDTQVSDQNWIISFVHEEGTERFKKFVPPPNSEIEVTISAESGDGYLCADGTLSTEKVLATRFIARYS